MVCRPVRLNPFELDAGGAGGRPCELCAGETVTKYHKLDNRTGCKACVHFTTDTEGKNWVVTKFIEEHNHPLVLENDIHLLRSNRKVSGDQGSILKNMTGVGIRTSDAYMFIAGEVGGFENVGFSKSDVYIYVQRERAALVEADDSNSLLKLFKDRQMEDRCSM